MKKVISDSFRQSMNWLHTWLGLALGMVLFAVFWTGTLTVFDKEIDQWMKPELRIAPEQSTSLDAVMLPQLEDLGIAQNSEVWFSPPQHRLSAIRMYYASEGERPQETLFHPKTGERLDLTDSHAGSEFFFPFHYMLHVPGIFGYLIVGIASLAMLVLTVSGIFIHRKIFQDFFTFRPEKKARRASLDLHNLTALIALPFHVILPFTGLFIFAIIYFPSAMGVPYNGDEGGYDAEISGYEALAIEPAGEPGQPVVSLDRPLQQAADIWQDEEGRTTSGADWVGIFNYGDANSYVLVERYFPSGRVSIGPHQMTFDPQTGEMIDRFDPQPVHAAANWLEGLHWIQFEHWPLRWLYFVGGLAGCVMIGSGLVFWMQARIRKGQADPMGVRFVRALSVAAMPGIIFASAVFLIANRLIPKAIDIGPHRHDLEIWAFFAAWLVSLVHASLRGRRAWAEQCIAIAFAAPLAVILNWATTGDHIPAMFAEGIWSVAIMDLILIAGGIVAFAAARRLQRPSNAHVSRSRIDARARINAE